MATRERIARLAAYDPPASLLAFRDNEALRLHLPELPNTQSAIIGTSRNGQDLFGMSFGTGNVPISLIAGCHADEPVGPMTAQALPVLLDEVAPDLLDAFRFHVVPQMNPDGADTNRAWFSDPLSLESYIDHVARELPGDDIEFGFDPADPARPENAAAMAFLTPSGPFAAHYSLHGMGYSTGAWCLICREWGARVAPYMDAFDALCERLDVPLHDVDRDGEKGFTRLRKGYCTTPRSDAMQSFFQAQNDPTTAALFRPSSMEWITSLGGDPLCLVSELPLFRIGNTEIADTFRDDLTAARAVSSDLRAERLEAVQKKYALSAMPIRQQMQLQLAMIVLSLDTLVKRRDNPR